MSGFTSRDATLVKTQKFPTAGKAGSTATDAIDLGVRSAIGVRSERFELEIAAPETTDAQLPSGTSATLKLVSSDSPSFETSTVERSWTLSGAGEARAFRFRPTLESNRYWRVECETTGTTGAGSDALEYSLAYVC